MIEVIEYISLFIWMIFLFLSIYRETCRKKEINIFHLIRVDSVFFLALYIIYNDFARYEVLPYLYSVIIITSLVYLLYDIVDNYKFKKIAKKDYIYYIGGMVVVALVLIYYFIWGRITKVFIITLIVNLLIPGYVRLINRLKKN